MPDTVVPLATADAADALFGFVTLLVFPLLGVLAMFKRRASPLLWAAVGLWVAVGGLMLLLEWPAGASSERFVQGYAAGTLLGFGFVIVDWLRTRRKVAKWLKLAIAALTLAAFVKALHDFLQRYA